MKNSLSLFESIISGNLCPFSNTEENLFFKNALKAKYKDGNEIISLPDKVKVCLSQIKPIAAKYYYYNDLLNEEIESTKKRIKESIYEFKTDSEIENYVHRIQHEILNLSLSLSNRIESSVNKEHLANDFSDNSIIKLTHFSLEELLRFLENNYLKYTDKNTSIPWGSSLLKTFNVSEKLIIVKAALHNANLCSELVRVIYAPFIKLSAISLHERISYNQLNYFNLYLDSFYEEIIQNNNQINHEQVINILYAVNYNSTDLVEYEVGNIEERLKNFEDESQSIDYMYYCLKATNQKQSKQSIAFDSEFPSLKNQITNWLEEEIHYRKRYLDLVPEKSSIDLLSKTQTKLATGLSVSQLACFFKLLVDAGVVLQKNQRDVFRHIADCYSTSKAAEISLESISNKYYAIESSSAAVIREYLIEMLNITKDFI